MITALRTLYRGDNAWDILATCRKILVGSVVAVVICLLAIFLRGFNLGIEFEGGSVWEVPATQGVTTDDIADAAAGAGLPDARVQKITGGEDIFRVRGELTDQAEDQSAPAGSEGVAVAITAELAEAASVDASEVSNRTVSPSFGDEVAGKARRALVVFFVLIALYLWMRFEWKMSVGALVAVTHDIVITVGFYALFQIEVTPATVVAFLTIMGYSLYDTIVVFDRVRDNQKALSTKSRVTYDSLANVSLNQVLMRSLNTSLTSVLPVVSLLVVGSVLMGASTLQEFGVALLVGLLVGAFSSIVVAMPVVVALKRREAHWAEVARAVEQVSTHESIGAATNALAAEHYSRNQAPRPRKKGRRR